MFWKIYNALNGPVAWRALERILGIEEWLDRFLDEQEEARKPQS